MSFKGLTRKELREKFLFHCPSCDKVMGTMFKAKKGSNVCLICTREIARNQYKHRMAGIKPQNYYQCTDCDNVFFHSKEICPKCGSKEYDDYLS